MLSRLSSYCSSLGFDSKTSILGCFILILFWKLFAKSRKVELLSKLPGPKPYPLIGNFREAMVPRLKRFKQITELAKKYGEAYVMWVGSVPAVWISGPESFEVILHSSSHLRKGYGYKFVEAFLGTGLITSNGAKWQKHRKILTPAFHFKILDSFFDIFKENLKVIMNILDKKAEDGKVFDIYKYVNNYALDNICEAAMGVKLHTQKEDMSEYSSTIMRVMELLVYRMNKIWLFWDWIYYKTPDGKKMKEDLPKAHAFVDNVIEERRKVLQDKKSRGEDTTQRVDEFGRKKRLAFLDLLLESIQNDNVNISLEDIRDEVNTFMFAGHDTTTSAIVWSMFLIGHHPEVQEDLYREQRDIYGDDMERPIMQEDLPKMELLDRVMKECIRLYPSVPFIARKLDSDVKFGNYIIPKDTSIALNIFSLHRNPAVFPEPEKFDPDRFLPENITQTHVYGYVPFSAGARNCIGKRFALLEEKLTLASMIRRYEIKSVDKPEDLTLVGELVLRSHTGINVILKKRVHN